MKAVNYTKYGLLEARHLEAVEKSTTHKTEVLIKYL